MKRYMVKHKLMKAILLLSLGLLGACATTAKKASLPPANPDFYACSEDIKPILEQFVAAVGRHDQTELLQFMDAVYLHEQHDQFLEGRTEQFLNEFFSAQSEGGEFFNVSYQELKGFRIIKCRSVDADWRIYATYQFKGKMLFAEWTLRYQEAGGWGFVGAMG